MEKVKVIRNFNDANKLLEKGYKIIRIDRDYNNKSFLVFLFINSEALQEELKIITMENKNRKSTYEL